MSTNKKIGIVSWVLGLVLSNVLLFCLNNGITQAFWIATIFVWVAYVSVLIFQLIIWKKKVSPDVHFLHIPAITISFAYMIAQIPVCIIFSLGSVTISPKAAILVNASLLVLAWMLIIGSLSGREHIERINNRQKNHHVKL